MAECPLPRIWREGSITVAILATIFVAPSDHCTTRVFHSEAIVTRSMSSLMVPFEEDAFRKDRFSYDVTRGLKRFGPFVVDTQEDSFDSNQQRWMKYNMGIQPVIRYRESWGIWVGYTCTRQCRHVLAFWSTSIPPVRRGPCSRLGIYPVCQGKTCTIDVV